MNEYKINMCSSFSLQVNDAIESLKNHNYIISYTLQKEIDFSDGSTLHIVAVTTAGNE